MTAAAVRTGNLKMTLTFSFEELNTDPALPLSGPTASDVAAVLASVEALAAFSAQAVELGVPLVRLLVAILSRWPEEYARRQGATPEAQRTRAAWEKLDPLYLAALS